MPMSRRRACTAGRAATGSSCSRSCCMPALRPARHQTAEVVDNLRRRGRAGVAALLALSLATGVVSPFAALVLVALAFSAAR